MMEADPPTGATKLEPQTEPRRLQELLQALVRTQKSLRLYEGSNAVTERMESDLYDRMSGYLKQFGPLELAIREFQLLHGDTPVYESRDRKHSLAFLLYRDGVRRLSFLPEVSQEELHSFLTCLNRVGVLVETEEDLVTLFWDQDFGSIRYHAVEEISEESPGPQVRDQLASRSVEAREDAVSLQEIEQPVSHIPTESVYLSDEEIDALHNELTKEEQVDLSCTIAELAIELTLQETSEEESARITENVLQILDRYLEEGELTSVFQAVEHLEGLAEAAFREHEAVVRLARDVVQAMADPKRIEHVLAPLESGRLTSADGLKPYLMRLVDEGLPEIVKGLQRVQRPAMRRAFSEAVLTAGDKCLDEVGRIIAAQSGEGADAELIGEILFILRHLPEGGAVPLVLRLLRHPDPAIRWDAALALGHFQGPRVEKLWFDLLSDTTPEIRGLAVTALVRSGKPELAPKILERLLDSPHLAETDVGEKKRVFAGVARLGGEASLPLFERLLQSERRRWFVPRTQQELKLAAVHGISSVGTEAAQNLLRSLAESSDRNVRALCLQELESRGKSNPAAKR